MATDLATGGNNGAGETAPEIDASLYESVDPALKESVVLVAGKTKAGKSTALNNIFHLDLSLRPSPLAEALSATRKKRVKRKNGRDIIVVDTRSLAQLKLEDYKTVKEWEETLKGAEFTLVYCLSVAPCSAITAEDRSIINNIHWYLGYGVWNKAVLLLTFSDTARRELFPDDDEAYKAYLKNYSDTFRSLLMDCGADVSNTTIFDYGSQEFLEKLVLKQIVAIPVGKFASSDEDILLGLCKDGRQWPDFAFHEIQKKSCMRNIRAFSFFYHYVQVVGGFCVSVILGAVGGYKLGGMLTLASPVIGLGVKSSESAAIQIDMKTSLREWAMILGCCSFAGLTLFFTFGQAIRSLYCGIVQLENQRALICLHKFRRLQNYFIK